MTSTARGDPSNNSRAERCVGLLKRMGRTMLLGSGLPNSSDLWPLAVSHAAFCHRCSVQGRKVSCPRWGAKVFSRIKDTQNDSFAPRAREGFFCWSEFRKVQNHSRFSGGVNGVVELEPVSSSVST